MIMSERFKQFIPNSVRHRIGALRLSMAMQGHGRQFSFRYFSKWDMVKLRRYVGRQLPSDFNHQVALFWTSVDEYRALRDVLKEHFPNGPKLVMDFGCGLGRSSVFFRHMMGWNDTKFLMVDGHQGVYGGKENMRPEQSGFHHHVAPLTDSFYTDFDLLDRFLVSNNMQSYDLIELGRDRQRLAEIREVDLFYSFHSVAYHYDAPSVYEEYGLCDVVRPGGLVILGIRRKSDSLRQQSFSLPGYEQLTEIQGSRKQDFVVLRRLWV